MMSPAGIARCHIIGRCHSFLVTSRNSDLNSGACKDIMNSVLKVVKSALKLVILGWVVVYDKYKTTLVSDPRHQIALVDILRRNQLVRSGDSDQTLVRFSYFNAFSQQPTGKAYFCSTNRYITVLVHHKNTMLMGPILRVFTHICNCSSKIMYKSHFNILRKCYIPNF
jgi:hypothetical protein